MSDQISCEDEIYPIDILPEQYQDVFSTRFQCFNQIQSSLFDLIVKGNKSLAICSPTASGKTVLLELAIIHELMKQEYIENGDYTKIRVLYLAPLKAIIEEKCDEWQKRFAKFGIKCFILTGDTEMEKFNELRGSHYLNANILLSTPEKFDHLIRNYSDSRQSLKTVQLILIDEVHLLADRIRGDVLEATITRMKAIRDNLINIVDFLNRPEMATQNSHVNHLRFMAISATAPNVDDIAGWLDITNGLGIRVPCQYRPVKLSKFVFGFEPIQAAAISEYRFDIQLSYLVERYIREYSSSKPTLVFCSTRRSVEFTAKILASSQSSYYESDAQRSKLFYEYYRLNTDPTSQHDGSIELSFKNPEIKLTLASGVAFYHSGLHYDDRRLLEKLFSMSLIPVLISTSSLAMGVNLPAHLVIIKNTVQYNAGSTVEYEISQILQMIGRAGRPQFDTEAKAIILTKNDKKSYYESILTIKQNIESNLCRTLTEQLTTEIVLQTINSFDQAVNWICSTFLFIRVLKNPIYYGSKLEPGDHNGARQMVSQWCQTKINHLKSLGIVNFESENNKLHPTQLARILTRQNVSVATAENLIQLTKTKSSFETLFTEICQCKEISQDVILRVNEKRFLNELNKKIKFPFKKRFTDGAMKINCLIQAGFECLNIETGLIQDSNKAINAGQRVSKCFLDIIVYLLNNSKIEIHLQTIVAATRLAQTFRAHMWYDSVFVVKQLPKIGPTFSTILVENGYTSFEKLIRSNPRNIEFCIKRNPPFGSLLLEEIRNLPKYSLILTKMNNDDVCIDREILTKIDYKIKIRLQCKLDFRKNPEKSLLKPEKHFVLLIVGCQECDQIFFLHRINDLSLINSQAIIVKQFLMLFTNIEDDENHDTSKNTTGNTKKSKEKAVQKPSKAETFQKFRENLKKSLPKELPFHCGSKNQSRHTIQAFIISELFVGLDCEAKLELSRSDINSAPEAILATQDSNSDEFDLENASDDEDLAKLLDDYNELKVPERYTMDDTSDLALSNFDSPTDSVLDVNYLQSASVIPKPSASKPFPIAKPCVLDIDPNEESKQHEQIDAIDVPETNLFEKIAEYRRQYRNIMPTLQERNNLVQKLSQKSDDEQFIKKFFAPVKHLKQSIAEQLMPRKRIRLKPRTEADKSNQITSEYFNLATQEKDLE